MVCADADESPPSSTGASAGAGTEGERPNRLASARLGAGAQVDPSSVIRQQPSSGWLGPVADRCDREPQPG